MIPLAAALLLAVASQEPQHAHPASPTDSVPLYRDLGTHGYVVTTAVPRAQQYFDQGLRLYYAFNHAEAIRSFRAAQRLDPECALCWWGEALSWGPNINLPMDSAAGVAAYAALQRAVALRDRASERELSLIDALARRYAAVPLATNRAALDSAYAKAMAEVVARYPEDAEAAVLYGESLMDLRPWNYWTEARELEPGVARGVAHFERVVAGNQNHPGACHFFIHAVEQHQPERAVECAERLERLMPGAGHLVHMPGHIYVRVGRYEDVIRVNEHAVHADESYIRDQRPGMGVYTAGYYPHNYDFLSFASMMVGRSAQTIGAAEKLASLAPDEVLHVPGMSFVQHHRTRPLQFRVRFAQWPEILRTPAPPEELPHARAMWHYAHGRALAATGDVPGAEADLAALRQAMNRLEGVRLEFNPSPAVLKIGAHALAGHIAAARDDLPGAVTELQEAVRSEDALLYGEPPEWSVPVRQELGALLLKAGRAAEAEAAFRADLERFRENGWSLYGLAESLRAQGRTAEADEVMARFRTAWRSADVGTPPSTF